MRYFSMFSGIGGFELGFPEDWECVGFSEIDYEVNAKGKKEKVWTKAIYRYHFPEHRDYGDARTINVDTLPTFDLLCGGFPCPSFSVAGPRGGFEDPRGKLFFEIARILQAKKPGYFLIENVKGLFSSDEGDVFAEILETLSDLGYDLQWQCCNSKYYGVPQNRERVFIIGHLRGQRRPEVFPLQDRFEEIPEKGDGEGDIAGCLSTRNQSGQANWDGSTTLINVPRFDKLELGDTALALASRDYKSPRTMVAYGVNITGRGVEPRTDGLACTLKGQPQGTKNMIIQERQISPCIRAEHHNTADVHFIRQTPRGKNKGGDKELCPTISSNSFEHNHNVSGIRRLTPTECERLQGFPDGWTRFGIATGGG